MRPPSDVEVNSLPQAIVTPGHDWNTSVLDFDDDDEKVEWLDAFEAHEEHLYHDIFVEYGNDRKRVMAQSSKALRVTAGAT
jgi:hypothetical protein